MTVGGLSSLIVGRRLYDSPFRPWEAGGVFSSKMGKCYEITHFLDFRGIWHFFSQPNNLIRLEIKKCVPLVPLVPTVPFGPATLVFEAQGRRTGEKLRVEASDRRARTRWNSEGEDKQNEPNRLKF